MKIIVAIALLALTSARSEGAKSSATEAIKTANTHLRELLAQKAEGPKVTRELRDLFDIADLAKRALVDHWDEMKPPQRTQLVDTLRQVVERNYVSQLRSNLQYDIVYQGEEPQASDVLVKTVIKSE